MATKYLPVEVYTFSLLTLYEITSKCQKTMSMYGNFVKNGNFISSVLVSPFYKFLIIRCPSITYGHEIAKVSYKQILNVRLSECMKYIFKV